MKMIVEALVLIVFALTLGHPSGNHMLAGCGLTAMSAGGLMLMAYLNGSTPTR